MFQSYIAVICKNWISTWNSK